MDAPLGSPKPGVSPQIRKTERPDRRAAEEAVRTLIAFTGDDPDRPGLLETPKRVIDAYAELYGGYGAEPAAQLSRTFEDLAHHDDLVVVRDIPVHSHCEHHMMPFTGVAYLGYYPGDRVTGLSKLARLVEVLARRLQSQERLTAEIVEAIDEALKPRGTAVLIDTEHTCMTTRGVRAHGARTITTQFSGCFRDDHAEQARFLGLAGALPRG